MPCTGAASESLDLNIPPLRRPVTAAVPRLKLIFWRSLIPQLILLAVVSLAILWLVGEAGDKAILRRIAGPLLLIVVATIAYGVASLRTSFDTSIRYSGAMKAFVSATVSAIDRGDVDAAHSELRRFESVSMETYEGGAFLRWLRESTTRLSSDAGRGKAETTPAAPDTGNHPMQPSGEVGRLEVEDQSSPPADR